MDLRSAMLTEFLHEADLTRSIFKTIPKTLLDFQATESLRSIRWNVSHLVDIPTWTEMILQQDSFDVAPVGQPPHDTPLMQSMDQANKCFDVNIDQATDVIGKFDIDTLEDSWSLLAGGESLLTHPRYMIYRMYSVNHVAHHRGHLLAYLRLNNIETPHIYG